MLFANARLWPTSSPSDPFTNFQANHVVLASASAWQRVALDYTIAAQSYSLDAYFAVAMPTNLTPGDCFYIDDVALYRR
jgi:hypothetical protein